MADSLQDLLARLKAEIEDAQSGDLDKDELARLAGALEDHLKDDGHDDLGDRLRDGTAGFEASHPRLAGLLRSAAESLSVGGL